MALYALLNRLSSRQKEGLKQALAVVPPNLRQSLLYRHWRRFLVESQSWSAEKIREWQIEHLRRIVRHAVENTEGYRELYREARIKPNDIRGLEDLGHLPFTTKELLRDNLAAFSVRKGGGRYVTTGGSTGIPFGFYELPSMQEVESAFMHTGWSWAGWKLGQPSAVLRGGFVGTAEDWSHYQSFHREFALSSYHLTTQTVGAYVEAIRRRNIRVLQAYPSALNLLCDLIEEQGLGGKLRLEIIFLGSENVYDWQLEKFEQTFPGTSLFAWYGHCEKAVLAPWCEKSRHFHAWPFYGVTEIIDADGSSTDEGGEGEIVGTSFHQTMTPFIRYRTMDYAVKGASACPACGRAFPVLTKISGRAQEVIVTSSGRYISMTAVNMHDDVFDGLRQFQFFQEKAGEIVFNYVPKAGRLSVAEETKIYQRLTGKLGEDVALKLRPVREIARTKSGKYRFLDQRVPIRYGDSP
jgi:phenylacetate-CoA ligase